MKLNFSPASKCLQKLYLPPSDPSHFRSIPGKYLPPANSFLPCSNDALLGVFGSCCPTAPRGSGSPCVAF